MYMYYRYNEAVHLLFWTRLFEDPGSFECFIVREGDVNFSLFGVYLKSQWTDLTHSASFFIVKENKDIFIIMGKRDYYFLIVLKQISFLN